MSLCKASYISVLHSYLTHSRCWRFSALVLRSPEWPASTSTAVSCRTTFRRSSTPASHRNARPCDIFETSSGIEISMDLPGVSTSEIEIVFAHNVLLIAGRKLPRACDDGNAAFHVAERAFGRFARAVTVDDAFDMSRAAATLTAGELRVVLPRQPERRGRQI